MKNDLHIPEVSGVSIVAILEHNDIYKKEDWNIYIINEKGIDLEMVLIVSKGFDDKKENETSVIRKRIENLPANSFAKVELIQPELFKLTNQFQVSFFDRISNLNYTKNRSKFEGFFIGQQYNLIYRRLQVYLQKQDKNKKVYIESCPDCDGFFNFIRLYSIIYSIQLNFRDFVYFLNCQII